jgi:ADP-heptose:LPS heptosyltransferase
MTIKRLNAKQLQSIKKILIIQYKPFGDVLLNTGYLPALRKKFPNAQIDFLIQKPYKIILEDNQFLDNLLIIPKLRRGTFAYFLERIKTILKVRKGRYDLVIDQIRNTGSAYITLFSGAKFRLGWELKRWNWVYNFRVPRDKTRYYARMKFDLLAPLGIKEQNHNLDYKIHQSSFDYVDSWLKKNQLNGKNIVLLSPGSPVKSKKWKAKCYAQVGDLIMSKTDFKVILMWAPDEKEDCKKVAALMTNEPIIAPPTTFNQAGALLKRAKMLICNDGGLNHLAVAMETPSIAIF